jgi:hypothetical protein
MGPGFSRDVIATERERGENRSSLRCSRSWCCSRLLLLKRVSSLLTEAKQTIPEEGSGSHCTTGDIALHISLHSAFQWCIRLDQAEDIPNPLPPMAAEHGFISIIDSTPERGARGSCPAGRCNAPASLLLTLTFRRGADHEISTPCSFAKNLSLQREGPLLGALRGGILNGP